MCPAPFNRVEELGSGVVGDGQEKTHVLTSDCIISEIGRCEAGTMISESDVLPSTWQWLLDRSFVRSVEEIELEADAEDLEQGSDDSQTSPSQTESQTAGTEEASDSKKPAAGKARK